MKDLKEIYAYLNKNCSRPQLNNYMNFVKSIITAKFGVHVDLLHSKSQQTDVCYARHIAIYFMFNSLGIKKSELVKQFNRKHSTIIQTLQSVEDRLKWDKDMNNDVASLNVLVDKKTRENFNSFISGYDGIYLNEFKSIKVDDEKTIILKGYSANDAIKIADMISGSSSVYQYSHTGILISEKYDSVLREGKKEAK